MTFRFFSFSLLIGLGAVLGHLYLYRRMVRPLVRHPSARRAIAGVLLAFTAMLMFRRTLQHALPESLSDVVTMLAYSWMGIALCLVIALLALDAVRAALSVRRMIRAPALAMASLEPPPDDARRALLMRAVSGGALLTGSAMAGYGGWRAFAPPVVTEVPIRIARLPRALDGLSIVQLTDVHVGAFVQRRFLDALVEHTNALRPDVIAITGDLVDGDVPTLGGHVAALHALKARYGSYFVTGNHDYYSGDDEWTAFLETLGINVLRNRRVAIGDAGGSIDLAGVDDWSGGRRRGKKGYDLEQALAGRNPDRAAVLLAHQPANFPVAAERGVDLQISGHTHGGQLFPMTMLVGLRWEHFSGLYRQGDAHIYVSRGCGFWGPPMRVGSEPELVKYVLTT